MAELPEYDLIQNGMIVIGLTGGIASGKSFVADCLVRFGGELIDADKVAHEVLDDPGVVSAIVGEFGNSVLDRTGKIDRSLLGKQVFANSKESENRLELLESITHPEIRRRIFLRLSELKASPDCRAIVLDIPLLFEGEWDRECDAVIFVDTRLSIRKHRAEARGWTDGELERRESRQLAITEKKERSSCVIDNSGGEKDTREQLTAFWEKNGLSVE